MNARWFWGLALVAAIEFIAVPLAFRIPGFAAFLTDAPQFVVVPTVVAILVAVPAAALALLAMRRAAVRRAQSAVVRFARAGQQARAPRVRVPRVGAYSALVVACTVLGGFALFAAFPLGAGLFDSPADLARWTALLAAALVVLLSLAAGVWAGRRRSAAWRRYCAAHGWRYDDDGPAPQLQGLDPFASGGTAEDMVRGTLRGVPFQLFTYEWETGKGGLRRREGSTHRIRVAAVAMPVASPGLVLEPESAGDRARDAVRGNDIDFESEEFSRLFRVTAPDRRFAYDALPPAMLEFLLGVGPAGRWQWRGAWLAWTLPGRMTMHDLEAMAQRVVGFRERVPRLLFAAQTAKPAAGPVQFEALPPSGAPRPLGPPPAMNDPNKPSELAVRAVKWAATLCALLAVVSVIAFVLVLGNQGTWPESRIATFLVGWAAVAGAFAVAAHLMARQGARMQARRWSALVADHGWTSPPDRSLLQPDDELPPWLTGSGHVARNIVIDLSGVQVFQHEATTHDSDGNSSTAVQTVCVLRMPVASPGLVVRREGRSKRLGKWLGARDLNFESEEFSKRFWVTSNDAAFAYAALTPQAMEWLLARRLDWAWSWRGPWLVLHRSGRLRLEDVAGVIEAARGFAALVPRSLDGLSAQAQDARDAAMAELSKRPMIWQGKVGVFLLLTGGVFGFPVAFFLAFSFLKVGRWDWALLSVLAYGAVVALAIYMVTWAARVYRRKAALAAGAP